MEETMRTKAKGLFAAAIGGLWGGEIQAQGGVTLYGVVDAGIEYVNHADKNGAGSVWRMASGNSSGTRWGLRGTEELGGGLQAIFALESGSNLDTGTSAQGGRLFGRQAFVGVSGPWGLLTLGRQYIPLYDLLAPMDPMRFMTYSVLAHDLQLSYRADNTVKYTGNFGALTLSAMGSTGYDSTIANGGEVPGVPRVGQELGAGAAYSVGAFGTALIYDQRRGASVASAGSIERRYAAALFYKTGALSTMAGYRHLQSGLSSPTYRSNLLWLGGSYAVSPAFILRAAVYWTDRRHSPDDAISYAFQADYNLSKRTDLYLTTSYMRNKGGSQFGVVSGTSVPAGVGQTGVVAGIRHTF